MNLTRRRDLIVALASSLVFVYLPSSAVGAACRGAGARGPGISGADIAAVHRAVVVLPAVGTRSFPMGVGALVPRDVEVKPVPAVVVKLLPQYAGYQSFRSGYVLMIVSPRSRRISYRLPLRKGFTDGC